MRFKSAAQRKAVMAKMKKPVKADYVEALNKYYAKHPALYKVDMKRVSLHYNEENPETKHLDLRVRNPKHVKALKDNWKVVKGFER
jgi:hypothetical protein